MKAKKSLTPLATDSQYPFRSEWTYGSGAGFLHSMPINSIVNGDGTPTGVYKTERNVLTSTFYPGDIVYTLPNVTAGVNHTVRLYFANNGYSIYPGDVVFDIYINNVLKASNFDLIGEAGGSNIGIWRDYANITPNGSGQIVVKIVPKGSFNETWGGTWYYNGTISGIKVTAQ